MQSHIVVGLAFGDEGKGSWVDHLVRKHSIRTVVRFNGGAQALHHVTTPTGVIHGFSQFGSGSFIPGVRTLLSRFMLIEPLSVFAEAASLREVGVGDALQRMYVSDQAPIIPYSNVLMNRILEVGRGSARHGSCGLGIGLTQGDVETLGEDALYARDLTNGQLLRKVGAAFERTRKQAAEWKSEVTQPLIDELSTIDVHEYATMLVAFARRVHIVPDDVMIEMMAREPCVFEGAQGVLLDQHHGFFPHCTRSTTTSENARTLLSEARFNGEVVTHGLLRAYGTRHGAGPFVTEDRTLHLPACDNTTGAWQGSFRLGWFDGVAAKYALRHIGGVDHLVVTNLDRLDGQASVKIGVAYDGMAERWYDRATQTLVPVTTYEESRLRTEALFSARPTYESFDGWTDSTDMVPQNAYIDALERYLEHPIGALSRRKDNQKIYRI